MTTKKKLDYGSKVAATTHARPLDYDGPAIMVDTSIDLNDETVNQLVEETVLPVSKPGDADYDWSAEYGTSDLYTHKFPNGIVVALKPFGDIFSKTWLYKIRNFKTNIDIELAAIDRGTCDAAKEVLESLEDDDDADPIAELWTAWSKSATSNGDGDEGLTSGN